MSEAEREAFWREVKRGPKPEPMDMTKTAREMTPAEREAFLKECARRAG